MTASVGKLYSYPNNPRVAKVLIAAKYNGVEVEQVAFEFGVTNKSPEFLAKFPLGKVPAFETNDGLTLFESNAIANYVALYKEGSTLLGKTKSDAAKIMQFIFMADNELMPSAAAWLFPIMGYMPPNKASTEKAMADTKRVMEALNKILEPKTFLVGESITLADITLVCHLLHFYKLVFDPSFRSSFKNVTRWFTTCVNQPNFKAVLGEVTLCEKMQVAQPAKAQAAPSTPSSAPAPASKATKAPKKKSADADDLEEESFADEKPKGKNPLDLLPPSSLNLDEWKRFYSNNDTRPDACDWFWKHFDPTGFSIWRVDYKYNSELTQVFMSSNLVGGFFQRLDRARKYAFGSMLVCGENGANLISGYFVFRGQDVPAEVVDAADYESYNFTKVDPSDPKVQEEFNAVIAWDATIQGKKCADGKVFK